jgi:hypothetical protein
MDCCCINRPFDDTTDPLVLIEGQAIISIALKCICNSWVLIGSDAVMYEINKTKNIKKKEKMLNLYFIIKENVLINKSITKKMYFYIDKGIKPLDSLHLACAEYGNVDVLLTTDKSFINKSKLIKTAVRVENPIAWLMEVITYGN